MRISEIWTFITVHWKAIAAMAVPLVSLFAAVMGAWIANRGWSAAHHNNIELERDKHVNAINLEKRKSELNFVSDQIRLLYGPLTALCETRQAAFNSMMRDRKRRVDAPGTIHFFDGSKLEPEELRQWRLWRTEVLMPLVVQMEAAILTNAHLLEGTTIPASFHQLMSHVASYRAVIKDWEYQLAKDKESGLAAIDEQVCDAAGWFVPRVPHTGVINFPSEFQAEVSATFERLKTEQVRLTRITQAVSFAEHVVSPLP